MAPNLNWYMSASIWGVKVDFWLTFSSHTDYIYSKVISRIGILGRAHHMVDEHTCLYLYNQLILPPLDYADFIYDGLPQNNGFTLQKLQNCAFRRILMIPRLTPSAYTHEHLDMDLLVRGRFKHVCIMTYKTYKAIIE